jgi:hypothetical protein
MQGTPGVSSRILNGQWKAGQLVPSGELLQTIPHPLHPFQRDVGPPAPWRILFRVPTTDPTGIPFPNTHLPFVGDFYRTCCWPHCTHSSSPSFVDPYRASFNLVSRQWTHFSILMYIILLPLRPRIAWVIIQALLEPRRASFEALTLSCNV